MQELGVERWRRDLLVRCTGISGWQPSLNQPHQSHRNHRFLFSLLIMVILQLEVSDTTRRRFAGPWLMRTKLPHTAYYVDSVDFLVFTKSRTHLRLCARKSRDNSVIKLCTKQMMHFVP